MVNKKRFVLSILLLISGIFFSFPGFAECGGNIQCIGVGASSADALEAHHSGPNKMPVFTFGSQNVETTSVSQTIFVAAVTGPTGTMVVLDAITISGADASEFTITGGSCSTTNGPVHGGELCTIDVAFSPLTSGSKEASVNVTLNPPACPTCIDGRIVSLVGVGGEVDPSTDTVVGGLVMSQAEAAKRISRVEIANVQRRFESLHRSKTGDTTDISAYDTSRFSGSTPVKNDYTTGAKPGGAMPLPDSSEDRLSMASVAFDLLSAVSSQSLNLSYSNNASDQSLASHGGVSLWIEGNVNFGTRDATISSNSLRFTTDGLSIGSDKQFGDNFTLGLGLGVARSETNIGTDGSSSQSEANSFFVYSSYQLSENIFIDALIGKGSLSYDLDRYIPSSNDFARGKRDGDQLFGSLSTSYEYRDETLFLAPYARINFTVDKLDEYTETGTVANAINYSDETLRSNHLTLGMRVESIHETNFGWVMPQLRVEWNHNAEDDRQNRMVYVNQPSGTIYTIDTEGEDEDSLLLGIGSDFVYRSGLHLGLYYSLLRASDLGSDQSLNLSLSKELDGKNILPQALSVKTFKTPIQLEASYLHSDNLNQTGIAEEELSEQIYTVKVSSRNAFSISRHTRLLFRGYLNSDRPRRYSELNKVTAGLKTEYQYRTSSAFDALTFGLFADVAYDDYDSKLRGGSRYSIGLSIRQLLTDKIGIFSAIQSNERNGDHDVFDSKYNALRLFADYSLDRSGTIYLGVQHRNGDMIASTASAATYYSSIALASTPDDAYTGQTMTATRFDAKTNMWTLGYNWPLGSRDAVDFSWINIKSSPTESATNVDYTTTRLSLAYFMRF